MKQEIPTALYRAYDADGSLLYVGIAIDWGARWSRHRERTRFYEDVARLDIEWHPTRAAALLAEAEAVRSEHPRHNVEYTARDRRPAAWRRTTDTVLYARPFDHRRHIGTVEYDQAYSAIDRLANSEIDLAGQEALVELLADMARSVPYGDMCDHCRDTLIDNDTAEWYRRSLAYPVAVQVEGQGLTATYRHHCGATWTCWWAIDAPLWFPSHGGGRR